MGKMKSVQQWLDELQDAVLEAIRMAVDLGMEPKAAADLVLDRVRGKLLADLAIVERDLLAKAKDAADAEDVRRDAAVTRAAIEAWRLPPPKGERH